MKLAIIDGSREAEALHDRVRGSILIDGDDLPERFDADAVVDGSHPCERETPKRVADLCEAGNLPLLRLRRAAWEPLGQDLWLDVPDAQAAFDILQSTWRRVFLTLGEADRVPFNADESRWYLLRTRYLGLDAPCPPNVALTEKDGPFLVEQEINLMRHHKIDVLVTRNAGGKGAVPKVSAARALGLPVVMVSRPPALAPEVTSIKKALTWWHSLARR